MSSLKPRKYVIGFCYLCQECLHCNKNCGNRGCRCRNNKEVTPENKKGQPRKYYSRTFQPKKTIKPYQLDELNRASEYYGYKTNFSEEFNFSLCTKCHNKYNRLGRKVNKIQEEEAKTADTDSVSPVNTLEIADTSTSRHISPSLSLINVSETVDTSALQKEAETVDTDSISPVNTLEISDTNTSRHISPSLSSINVSETVDTSALQKFASIRTPSEQSEKYADSLESESLPFEIKFKLILKFSDGKCKPAKWKSIMVEDFYDFKNGLENLVQSQLEDQVIFQDDYTVSYKHEKESGLGTQLASTSDWKEFLKEYERIISGKKVLKIIITMKKKPNKRSQFR